MIPPEANAAFVATMEDVLEVYQRPHDPQRPLVCLDETSKQLIIETRAPIPAKPGRKARHDYEYERNGVANLFMVFAPLEGWRHVKVTDRHTAIDYAHVLRDLSDTHFPDTAKIVLVQDNLNIHKPASLYEAFPAPEARRLVERFASPPAAPAVAPEALARLTARETDVLRLLARGMSNAEIAEQLVVSEATVKTHVAGILAKLGLRNRAQAVVIAYESGLVRANAETSVGG